MVVLALNRQLWTGKALIWSVGGLVAIASYFHGYVKPAQSPAVIEPEKGIGARFGQGAGIVIGIVATTVPSDLCIVSVKWISAH